MGTTDRTAAERNRRARKRRAAELEALRLFYQGIGDQCDTASSDAVVGRFCRATVAAYRTREPLGGSGGDSPPVEVAAATGNPPDVKKSRLPDAGKCPF